MTTNPLLRAAEALFNHLCSVQPVWVMQNGEVCDPLRDELAKALREIHEPQPSASNELDDEAFDKLVSLLIVSAYTSGASCTPSGAVEQSAKAIKECFAHLQRENEQLRVQLADSLCAEDNTNKMLRAAVEPENKC